MPRINPVNSATATGDAATHLAATKAAFGGTPNMFTTAANSPVALEALLGLFTTLGKASLGHRIGEQIALTVAQSNGCDYCLSAHSAIGSMRGLDAAALSAARRATASDAKTDAILKLALDILTSHGTVDDAALTTARAAGVTDGEIVEIIAHVALNVFTNYLNNVSRTDIDFPVVSADLAA